MSDNVVDGVVSTILAGLAAVWSNDFALDSLVANEPPPDGLVGVVVADTATYTSNHARLPAPGVAPGVILDVTRASAEAANLELTIA